MGRRAKNKQGAPEPLEKPEYKSKKQLGKRKADVDETDEKLSARPAKKAKDLNGKSKAKPSSNKKSSKIPAKNQVEEEEDDDSEGWEDVEDDSPAKTTKYASIYISYTTGEDLMRALPIELCS